MNGKAPSSLAPFILAQLGWMVEQQRDCVPYSVLYVPRSPTYASRWPVWQGRSIDSTVAAANDEHPTPVRICPGPTSLWVDFQPSLTHASAKRGSKEVYGKTPEPSGKRSGASGLQAWSQGQQIAHGAILERARSLQEGTRPR